MSHGINGIVEPKGKSHPDNGVKHVFIQMPGKHLVRQLRILFLYVKDTEIKVKIEVYCENKKREENFS